MVESSDEREGGEAERTQVHPRSSSLSPFAAANRSTAHRPRRIRGNGIGRGGCVGGWVRCVSGWPATDSRLPACPFRPQPPPTTPTPLASPSINSFLRFGLLTPFPPHTHPHPAAASHRFSREGPTRSHGTCDASSCVDGRQAASRAVGYADDAGLPGLGWGWGWGTDRPSPLDRPTTD